MEKTNDGGVEMKDKEKEREINELIELEEELFLRMEKVSNLLE
jgi:hypothetical protein